MQLKKYSVRPRRFKGKRKWRKNINKIEQGNLYKIIIKSLEEQKKHNDKIYEQNKNKGYLDKG